MYSFKRETGIKVCKPPETKKLVYHRPEISDSDVSGVCVSCMACVFCALSGKESSRVNVRRNTKTHTRSGIIPFPTLRSRQDILPFKRKLYDIDG